MLGGEGAQRGKPTTAAAAFAVCGEDNGFHAFRENGANRARDSTNGNHRIVLTIGLTAL